MKITFSVSGSVTQTIKIVNGDTLETVVERLNSGKYMTTVSGDAIERTVDGVKVAEIQSQDLDTTYEDFDSGVEL